MTNKYYTCKICGEAVSDVTVHMGCPHCEKKRMMLEKETSNEIVDKYNKEYHPFKKNKFENKIYISEENLLKWLENNTLKPNAECQSSRRQMEASIKREAFKIVLEELKEEKND